MLNTMTCDEFISLTRREPLNWINYCEILVTKSGQIILARPSHQEACIHYAMEVEHKTRSEIECELREECLCPSDFYVDKYGLICVWYECILTSDSIYRFQQHTLDKLVAEGLISKRCGRVISSEYRNYLERKELSNCE